MSAGIIPEERRLGPYILKHPLGEGGNGQVFLAQKQNPSGRPLVFVAKLLLWRHVKDEPACRRFLTEARLAIELGAHPNIVHVVDVDTHQQMPFIVMEYIDGADLHLLTHHLRKRRRSLPTPAVYNIFASVAAGLHHAHTGATIGGKSVGIVHRDIKPANILISRDGCVKIADFGIGASIEEGTTGHHWRGTARYMSPEHLRCEVRPEMDIYSLGVVAWEMVENRRFREECQGTQHYGPIVEGRIPPMRNREAPKQLISIIESCLDPNPRQRPTAAELLKVLSRCPGYSRDPDVLKTLVSSVMGTRRTSGATERHLAATPELVATFAVLERADLAAAQRDPSISQDDPGEDDPTLVQRAKPHDGAEPSPRPEPTKVVEPDAPKLFRRRPNPKPVSETIKLRADGSAQDDPSAKTPAFVPPWIEEDTVAKDAFGTAGSAEPSPEGPPSAPPRLEERSDAKAKDEAPVDLTARGGTEPGTPTLGTYAASSSLRTEARGWWRHGALSVSLATAGAISAALLTALGLGAFDEDEPESPPVVAVAQHTNEDITNARSELPTTGTAPDVAGLERRPARLDPEPPPVLEPSPVPASIATSPSEAEASSESSEMDVSLESNETPIEEPPEAPATPKVVTPPPPPVPVTLVLFLVDAADVKIGRRLIEVRRKTEVEIPVGRHRVQWRLHEDDPWQDMGRERFAVDHGYLVRVRSSGPPEIIEQKRRVK